MKNNTKASLEWITNILKQRNIPFQITGGLAVRAYGSNRELADIDIEIPDSDFAKIKDIVSEFIVFGPANHKSELWDLFLMTLNYNGQEIDISGAYQTKIFNIRDHTWVLLKVDLSKSVNLEIEGLQLPVIPRDELMAYKKILARPVDLLDLAYLEQQT